jgi:HK97 family phage major capsid protein
LKNCAAQRRANALYPPLGQRPTEGATRRLYSFLEPEIMKIAELRQRRAELAGKLVEKAVEMSAEEYGKAEKEIMDLDAQIQRAVQAQELARAGAKPVGGDADPVNVAIVEQSISPSQLLQFQVGRELRAAWGIREYTAHARALIDFKPDAEKHFRSMGEQLAAVARHYIGGTTDPRLVRAPVGAGETDASAGGFLVQSDFASAVWTRAYDLGDILSRVFKLPISSGSNGIKIPAVDESSRATGSRWGGVQSYWVGEGDGANQTKPKFRLIELDLKKLMSIMYVSDELLQDQSALETIASQAFSEEIMFMTEDAIFEGDGVGKPMGIMKAPCLVTVPKDNAQAAATLSLNNVVTMWSRMWLRSRKNAAWYINQDVEPQLYQLAQAVGTGGLPMFLPAGGLNAAPYASLFGRPLIPTEYSSALGTLGDITLADFSQYVLADKRGMQAATSMHVRFLTDEMTFRFTYRVDGEPLWNSALTPFKGSATKSPFVALAAR